jgi:hypothetical protein
MEGSFGLRTRNVASVTGQTAVSANKTAGGIGFTVIATAVLCALMQAALLMAST